MDEIRFPVTVGSPQERKSIAECLNYPPEMDVALIVTSYLEVTDKIRRRDYLGPLPTVALSIL